MQPNFNIKKCIRNLGWCFTFHRIQIVWSRFWSPNQQQTWFKLLLTICARCEIKWIFRKNTLWQLSIVKAMERNENALSRCSICFYHLLLARFFHCFHLAKQIFIKQSKIKTFIMLMRMISEPKICCSPSASNGIHWKCISILNALVLAHFIFCHHIFASGENEFKHAILFNHLEWFNEWINEWIRYFSSLSLSISFISHHLQCH